MTSGFLKANAKFASAVGLRHDKGIWSHLPAYRSFQRPSPKGEADARHGSWKCWVTCQLPGRKAEARLQKKRYDLGFHPRNTSLSLVATPASHPVQVHPLALKASRQSLSLPCLLLCTEPCFLSGQSSPQRLKSSFQSEHSYSATNVIKEIFIFQKHALSMCTRYKIFTKPVFLLQHIALAYLPIAFQGIHSIFLS